jgi:hypothetical protein
MLFHVDQSDSSARNAHLACIAVARKSGMVTAEAASGLENKLTTKETIASESVDR